jgi:hypothetical protein
VPISPQKPKAPLPLYRIILSNFEAAAVRKYENIITALGGVLEKDFTAQTTHVVALNLSRSKKCLAACARGVWLLKAQYLEDSFKQRRFLDEEFYEWKPEECQTKELEQIAIAAHKCRLEMERLRMKNKAYPGLFGDFKVLLLLEPNLAESWMCIIEAAGGSLIRLPPPWKKEQLVVRNEKKKKTKKIEIETQFFFLFFFGVVGSYACILRLEKVQGVCCSSGERESSERTAHSLPRCGLSSFVHLRCWTSEATGL